MDPAANQRIAPNRVVLILALLVAAWLGFEFYPRKKPAPPLAPVTAESKFQIAGLANNPDWDGLPELFAMVEKRAEWKDGRTRFAYWHPVMKTYSYYFEVTRDGAGFRFSEIAEPHDPDYYWDEGMGEDSRIRFYYSASLPKLTFPIPKPHFGTGDPADPEKIPRPEYIKSPALDSKPQPPDIEQKP